MPCLINVGRIRSWPALSMLSAVIMLGCAVIYPEPEPPHVTVADLYAIDVKLLEQRYGLRLRVQNPNSFALPIVGMDFRLEINDREFARGVSDKAVEVPAYGEALVDVDVVSNLGYLLGQLWDLEDRRRDTLRYRLSGRIGLANHIGKVPFEYKGEISPRP